MFDKVNDWSKKICKYVVTLLVSNNFSKKSYLQRALNNILTTINHFGTEIDLKYQGKTPSDEQVKTLIKQHSKTLKLKVLGNLEHHDTYLENPNEITFFHQLIRVFVHEIREIVSKSFIQKTNKQ